MFAHRGAIFRIWHHTRPWLDSLSSGLVIFVIVIID